ncbi:carbohydrate-binding protein [Hymenobacter siberiensis]|uniref:hypothetical protein n=1 Tax=Hymenobacter siberiensis TaxID=2848396 RepID=UPI001D021435|nr:hypothetical protein [Hymenobacter siberiensis]
MAAIYRPAALFLTNKENFVARTGDYAGTQINSSNMLWSLLGSLGLVYKVLFGLRYEGERLVFRPFVPQAFQGARRLTGFKYRKAVLDVEMMGFGNAIKSITLDGQPLVDAAVPASLSGRHAVKIVLSSEVPVVQPVNRVVDAVAPETPTVTYRDGKLHWEPIDGANFYLILRNGKVVGDSDTADDAVLDYFSVPDLAGYHEYQVIARTRAGLQSFASEPLAVGPGLFTHENQLETLAPKATQPYKGYAGKGFIEISTTKNPALTIPVTVPETGLYALDFRYANGNGPINTNNQCAIRTLRRGPALLGTVVLPQRGVQEWSSWGFSNPILVRLEKGTHPLTLAYEPANQNMNGEVNQAMLDYLRVRRVE